MRAYIIFLKKDFYFYSILLLLLMRFDQFILLLQFFANWVYILIKEEEERKLEKLDESGELYIYIYIERESLEFIIIFT